VQSHLSTSQLHQASVVARAPSLILPIDLVIPHGKSRNARPNSTVIPAASTPPDKDVAANSLICADSEISHEIEIGGSYTLRGADVQRDARAESSHQNSGFAHNMAHVPAVKYSFDENLDTSKALKLAVGSPNAVFKSAEQKKAMQLVAAGDVDLLICDRTGGGKTAVVFGPSILENSVTVYLSPLKALQQDLQSRCKRVQLPVMLLSDMIARKEKLPARGILLVSPEHVDTEDYRNAIGAFVGNWPALPHCCRRRSYHCYE